MEEYLSIQEYGDSAADINKSADGIGEHDVIPAGGQAPHVHDLRVLDNLYSAILIHFRFVRIQLRGGENVTGR
jgi:hypothetical protein